MIKAAREKVTYHAQPIFNNVKNKFHTREKGPEGIGTTDLSPRRETVNQESNVQKKSPSMKLR